MRTALPLRQFARGTSMIEAMISIVIVLIGLLGLASLQTTVVRANRFGRRMAQASALATDLEGNIKRWSYTDARLAAATTVTSLTDSTITSGWNLGRAATPSYTPHFSDADLGSSYQGLSADIDADNVADFTRYWNVFAVDLTGSGANGKLVQVIVRWKEPIYGYRQVVSSTFKMNPTP